MHIESFKDIAADWADRALDPESDYGKAAAALSFGDEDNDGVAANVNEFVRLVESGLRPPRACARGHKAQAKLKSGELLPKEGGEEWSHSTRADVKAYPQSA